MALFNLFFMFFRLGLFGFGGGYAILPLIFQSVQDFGFMSAQEFSRLVALSQVTPGPVAVNAATYVGFNYAGFFGALVATVGVAVPSFVLVILSMKFIERFKESGALDAVFQGIRPATVGLIASAVIFIAETSLIDGAIWELVKAPLQNINILPCAVFIGTIILAGKFKLSPIKITLAVGVFGALFM